MSAKWQRSKRWDDAHIPGWAFPVRILLRALSSVTLAVCLLVFVVVFATMASVPLGLLAQAPTWVFYALTYLIPLAIGVGLAALVVSRLLRSRSRALRFPMVLASILGVGALVTYAWVSGIWPTLKWDPTTGEGVMFLADVVRDYDSTTVRRLPILEMTEIEFYSWWPLRAVLFLFVLNMVVATVRRIEFRLPYIGVLTVHTGIVIIGLGSMYYGTLKLEGDVLLRAGDRDPVTGVPGPGPFEGSFYDHQRTALYIRGFNTGWEFRPVRGVPRYNDYALDAGPATSAWTEIGVDRSFMEASSDRELSIEVPDGTLVPDLDFTIVGYCAYGELRQDWVESDPSTLTAVPHGASLRPMRVIDVTADMQDGKGERSVRQFALLPETPAKRHEEFGGALSFEYTMGMSEERWSVLSSAFPDAMHALVIGIPDAGIERVALPIVGTNERPIGTTGWRVRVQQIQPTPPFPVITPGFENAESSLVVLTLTDPSGESFDRWVYSRYPELTQDFLGEPGPDGRPQRKAPDERIEISYIDASMSRVHLDERSDGSVRYMVRRAGGGTVTTGEMVDGRIDELLPRVTESDPKINLVRAASWRHSVSFERPMPTPEEDQNPEAVGTHRESAICIRIDHEDWSRHVWLPFTQYLDIGLGSERAVTLPDGRRIMLAFGRLRHRFPGFEIQMKEFEMIAYDHRGAPRDYQSLVRVIPSDANFEAYEHIVRLNAPLRAPHIWDPERALPVNLLERLLAGVDPAQFKFSQAGWDQNGWRQSQELVDQGRLERPFANFTILQVGNNPGIHIIALGSVLMGVGIPLAFYGKPMILRWQKRRIQAALSEGASS